MDKLNILMRTSSRPRGFSRMMSCIESQTYKNIKVYISCDNDSTFEYVSKYDYKVEHEIVRVRRDAKADPKGFFNLYFNDLKSAVSDGYIYHVDDDDVLPNENVFDKIMSSCINQDKLYIFRMNYLGRLLPGESFGKQPVHKDIGTQCFVYHSKYKNKAKWCDVYSADFNFVRDMFNVYGSKNTIWVDEVIYLLEEHHKGKATDI